MDKIYKGLGIIDDKIEKGVIDDYSKTCSSFDIACNKEDDVWGVWFYIDEKKYLVNPMELVNTLYLSNDYYHLLSIYNKKGLVIVNVRKEEHYISWESEQIGGVLFGRYTYMLDEYVSKIQKAITELFEIYKKEETVAYELEGYDSVPIESVRICYEQIHIAATLPSYFRITTKELELEPFQFFPLGDEWIENFYIGIGSRGYDTWLSHWDSDMEAIRHELESYVYERETTIKLPFDMSETTIVIKKESILDEVKDVGHGTSYSYKPVVSVDIRPNEFVLMPIIKGYCDEKETIKTLYEGLLNMARLHPVDGKEDSHDEPPSCIVAYNRYKSPIIEAFLRDDKKEPNTYSTRQVHIKHIIKIDADYDTFLWDEESSALDLSDLYDTEGKPIQMEEFEVWQREICSIIVDAAVGKTYEKDWDDYNKRGIELAKQLRKQLSPDFDLWYEPPFEDDSENKKATLII